MRCVAARFVGALLVISAVACRGDTSAEHADGGLEPVVVTQFTGQTELFVEFPPLVEGEDSPFAIHLTRLDDWSPVGAGRVAVELSGGGKPEERFVVDAPSSPGIFRPVVRPDEAVRRRVVITLEGDTLADRHDLGEVKVYEAADAVPNDPEEDAHGEIAFLKEQQWQVEFATVPVGRRELRPSFPANGRIRARPEGEARITAPVTGRLLTVGETQPRIGAEVQRDAVLAAIAPRVSGESDLALLELHLEKTRLHVEQTERERARLEGLLKEGAVPRRRVAEARHEEAEARAELEAAERRLAQYEGTQRASAGEAQGRIQIRSPIAGTLLGVRTAPGAFVEEGEELFYVVDLDRLWLEVRVPEADLGRVAHSPEVSFRVEGSATAPDAEPEATAQFVASGGMVDSRSRTVPLLFELENPDRRFRVGMFARARILTGEPTETVAVPASALIDDDGQDVVFVQTGGESFERRAVTTGIHDGGFVEVTKGLEPGERVVTEGAYAVRLASSSASVPAHGHAH